MVCKSLLYPELHSTLIAQTEMKSRNALHIANNRDLECKEFFLKSNRVYFLSCSPVKMCLRHSCLSSSPLYPQNNTVRSARLRKSDRSNVTQCVSWLSSDYTFNLSRICPRVWVHSKENVDSLAFTCCEVTSEDLALFALCGHTGRWEKLCYCCSIEATIGSKVQRNWKWLSFIKYSFPHLIFIFF